LKILIADSQKKYADKEMISIFDALKMSNGGVQHFPSKKPNRFLNIEQEFHHEISQLHSACHAAALLQMCISRSKFLLIKVLWWSLFLKQNLRFGPTGQLKHCLSIHWRFNLR
jgi:hypothetical protein